jgi:hypothetical protein
MGITVVTKAIKRKSKLWDDRAFRKDIQKVNRDTSRSMLRDYKRLVALWNHPVIFQQLTESTREDIIVIVGTEDSIFGYLDEGTSVRRALMSEDFSPKTRPGSLRSRPGQGGVVFISKDLALPGIEARDFTGQMKKKYEKKYKRGLEAAMRRARARRN